MNALESEVVTESAQAKVKFKQTDEYCLDQELEAKDESVKLLKISYCTPTKMLAAAYTNGQVAIKNLSSNSQVQSFSVSSDPITDICWYSQNQILLCSGSELLIYDVEKNKNISSYQGHNQTILTIAYNLFKNVIVSGGLDHLILSWDVRSEKPVMATMAHALEITSLQFSDDSLNILSTAADGFTRVWSLYNGLCKKTLCYDYNNKPTYSKFSQNGSYIMMQTLNSKISLWDWKKSQMCQTYQGHTNKVAYIESYFINQAGKHKGILTYSEDGQLYVWDVISEKVIGQQFVQDKILKIYLDVNGEASDTQTFFLYDNSQKNIYKYEMEFSA